MAVTLLATSDGVYGKEEKITIQGYCQEMNIPYSEEKKTMSSEKLIKAINASCNTLEKKIFIFEAIGLSMADKKYDNSERSIITSMIKEFQIDESFSNACEDILTRYFLFQEQINTLVIG